MSINATPTTAQSNRRRSIRTPDHNMLWWRRIDEPTPHVAWLLDRSDHGLSIMAENAGSLEIGTLILHQLRREHQEWAQPARIVRCSILSDILSLVALSYNIYQGDDDHAESKPTMWPETPLGNPIPNDRLMMDPASTDRRRSRRWRTDKLLNWRPLRGRKIRQGRVIERSLEGIAILADARDQPPVGSKLLPGDDDMALQFGFRCAVVRRLESPCPSVRLILAEIER